MFDFTGQVVLVTGAAGNLGQAVGAAFQTAGARLALVARSSQQLAALWPAGPAIFHCLADLTDPPGVTAAVDQVVAHYGRLDVLANIAGGFTMGPPIHETSPETWQFMLDLNARSAFLTSRAAIPHFRRQGRGKIINIAARAALEGRANMGPYCVSKAAVITLTETLAAENKAAGVNVNCILPGTLDTPQNRASMPDVDPTHWVKPTALAEVVLFLASESASAIHGAALPVYGLGG